LQWQKINPRFGFGHIHSAKSLVDDWKRIRNRSRHLGASKPDAFRIDAEFLPPPMRISLALGKAG
jgi:hypothetical protein